ncbi:hypothetical protein LVJ82_00595 [Vitreoscilla massiliensis]|uniref:Uncharacterized protein n=1 Tax=Vitreoscilla massiliensis TaxID=1689272 RepID=A0ABY4E145_9NEIS|nr:hypothetical protein [Vitreoscilla massiliensis]UOO89513.1 hypothetical protein LVJ82_00595 [Vitreoscilla massiliensis]
MDYITVADIANEPSIADKDRAVMLANLYMTKFEFKPFDNNVIPNAVKAAAIELARNYESLYADQQTGVLSESVQVDVIAESKSYSANAKFKAGWLLMVEDMLKPYLKRSTGRVVMLAKV